MGCHCDPHIVKKEDQFQEQSLSEESLFCRHLTAVYSELPLPWHLKCRIRWSVREWMLRRSDLYNSIPSANMWWKTEWWLITPERGWVYKMKRIWTWTEPRVTPHVNGEGENCILFPVTTCVLHRSMNRWKTDEDHSYQKCFEVSQRYYDR